jgi:hypothetical protein
MAPPKTKLEASHTIISLTMLATGRLILATEKRMYELVNNVWTPMIFADDEPDPEPTPAPTTAVPPPSEPAPFSEPTPEVKP